MTRRRQPRQRPWRGDQTSDWRAPFGGPPRIPDEEFARLLQDLGAGRRWATNAEWDEFLRRGILYCGWPKRPITVREWMGITRAEILKWSDEVWELFAETGCEHRWFLGIALDALPQERHPPTASD